LLPQADSQQSPRDNPCYDQQVNHPQQVAGSTYAAKYIENKYKLYSAFSDHMHM